MSEITIGQYFPGKSVVHKMDARMKIVLVILFIVALFISENFVSIAFVVAALIAIIAVSSIPFKTIRKSLKPLWMIIASV
ncbi:MAG: energy-coupling factor transporter transmembrane protein EcfT, partial [Eubacterium sp.]|nr:energy-coupling factor transporter transmembrane protein EcfT [Eubacterium sp.]